MCASNSLLGRLFCLIILSGLFASNASAAAASEPAPDAQQPRVWTDVSGKFSRVAVLVEVRADGVRLRQPSGRGTTIAWDQLSPADQAFVRDATARPDTSALAESTSPAERVWTDVTGHLRARARLVAVHGERLVLERPDGKQASARLSNLSASDRRFVQAAIAAGEVPVEMAQVETPQDPVALPGPHGWAAAWGRLASSATGAAEPLVPTWAQSSAPRRVIHVQVSRQFLDQFVPHDVDTRAAVNDVIVGSPVSGTSTTHGQGAIAFVPSRRQAIADIFFAGNSHADTLSDGGRAQIFSHSTTSFQARKRVLLDESGLHWLPAVGSACSHSQTCGICSSLPGLRGAIARRVATRSSEGVRGQADSEAASHFAAGLQRQVDRDVAASLVEVERFQRKFFAAARQGGLNLVTQCSSTTDHMDMAIFREAPAEGQAEPTPPAIAGDPPAAVWIHQSFLAQVLADASLRAALEPLVAGFLTPEKPAGPDGPSPSPSDRNQGPADWRIGWSQDGSWLTVSFGAGKSGPGRQRFAGGSKSPGIQTVAHSEATR